MRCRAARQVRWGSDGLCKSAMAFDIIEMNRLLDRSNIVVNNPTDNLYSFERVDTLLPPKKG